MSERVADKTDEKPKSSAGGSRRKWQDTARGATSTPVRREKLYPKYEQLMLAVVERENLLKALKRVESNKGASGMDNMSVESLRGYLKSHWPKIKEELLNGTYQPQPVLRVEIPKADGGVRKLGIPTADHFPPYSQMSFSMNSTKNLNIGDINTVATLMTVTYT